MDQATMPNMHLISESYTLTSRNKKGFYTLNIETIFNKVPLVFRSKHQNVGGVDMIEDGLIDMLQCDLYSETWGRPLGDGMCNYESPKTGKYFFSIALAKL